MALPHYFYSRARSTSSSAQSNSPARVACTASATCVSSHDVGFACPRQLGGLFLFEVMTMYVWILVSIVIGIMTCVWLDVRPVPRLS